MLLLISYLFTTSKTLSSLKNCTHYYHFYITIHIYIYKKHIYFNCKLSHITISSFFPSLINSNFSYYMKIKFFCSSQLKRYFHREAFLNCQTKSMHLLFLHMLPWRLWVLVWFFDLCMCYILDYKLHESSSLSDFVHDCNFSYYHKTVYIRQWLIMNKYLIFYLR